MIRAFCMRLALLLGCFAVASFVQAADVLGEPPTAVIAPVQQLDDEQLAMQRGGFSWQGMDIQFGAEIRSYIGDELVMMTRATWADGANNVERTVSSALTPVAANQLDAMLANGLNIRADSNNVFVANQGKTAFIQRTDGVIQNIIANVASNVDLRQEVSVTLDIASFAPFQNNVIESRISSALATLNGIALARSSPL